MNRPSEIVLKVTVLVPSGIGTETPKMDAAAYIPEIIHAIETRVAPLEILDIDVLEVTHDPDYS